MRGCGGDGVRVDGVESVPGVSRSARSSRAPWSSPGNEHVSLRFIGRFPRRQEITLQHLAARGIGPDVLDRHPTLVRLIHEMWFQGHYMELFPDGPVVEVFMGDVDESWTILDGTESMNLEDGDGTTFAKLITAQDADMDGIRKAGQRQPVLYISKF